MAGSSSDARIKCYVILQGLERSLGENILRNYDFRSPKFLNPEEQSKALKRLREDDDDPNLQLDDLDTEDLIPYLDLQDLINLLNRHIFSVKNVLPDHIRAATKLVLKLKAPTIRKRVMHPIRPLEVDDLPNLLKLAEGVQKLAPSMIWDPLAISARRLSKAGTLFDVKIPTYWAEESPIIHNLPPAEFDDTGFIGRAKERSELKKQLESDHRVITVVGKAGIGKTALSLRVCNDLLEGQKPLFDRIVWVTLKTKYLTAEGVRQINDAIDSLGALIDSILKSLKVAASSSWDGVIQQMKTSKVLLVVDNLETLGGEIRDLLLQIPAGSKVLLTSRVGLGEIEVRYELGGFPAKDAMALFRTVTMVYNCSPLKTLDQSTVASYTQTLGHNPLLIKWFVLAVARGGDPHTLLSNKAMAEPLTFFYSSIYDKLSPLAKEILGILLAARRELTKTQIQDLAGTEHIPFSIAIQELVLTSMVERVSAVDGTMVFQVRGLVYEYLSKNYPPNDDLVKAVRAKIHDWQVEQDRSAVGSSRYRYGLSVLHIEKADERVSAQHLLRALRAVESGDLQTATDALATAEQLTPAWWEVSLVRARTLEALNKPIYEVEEAFEYSIKLSDNDVNRFHYAAYLLAQNEHERALDQIDKASIHEEALPLTFKSLRGLTYMRMGRTAEAISELEQVWANRSDDLPVKVARTQGTQLADAYRRQAEKKSSLGEAAEAMASCVKAAGVINEVMENYGCDRRLVEMAVNIIACAPTHHEKLASGKQDLAGVAKVWDSNAEFRSCVTDFRKTLDHFVRNSELEQFFPRIFKELKNLGYMKRYVGQIDFLVAHGKEYAFITSAELGRIYCSRKSLMDRSIWPQLKVGDVVTFGVIVPREEDRLPYAVSLEVSRST